jgi:hypothetical protein
MADWDRIFEAAARATVAVEIDGDPRRQDIDHGLARRALAAGCIFALDSDAHAPAEWEFAETAIAHARLAQIPRERVINCWPLDFSMDWAASHSKRETVPATAQTGRDLARMRLFFALCSTSASPSASMTGGTYVANRPRRPFLSPYQPSTGSWSTVPKPRRCPPRPASARRRFRATSNRHAWSRWRAGR